VKLIAISFNSFISFLEEFDFGVCKDDCEEDNVLSESLRAKGFKLPKPFAEDFIFSLNIWNDEFLYIPRIDTL